jgi:hypothetical protein
VVTGGSRLAALLPTGLPVDVPVNPDRPQAKQWLLQELARPVYRAAEPTPFDRLAKAIQDWFASLRIGNLAGSPTLGIAIVVVIIVAAIVVAFVIFGVPRLNRRSALTGGVLGDSDDRTADQLRASANAAAAAGDYSAAIVEMFRAIARGLLERTIVQSTPGTTAHTFSTIAGRALPDLAARLDSAARTFDSVRYLNRAGTREKFYAISDLERELSTRHPNAELMPA